MVNIKINILRCTVSKISKFAYRVSVGKPQGGDYLRNLEVERREIIQTYRPVMERVTGFTKQLAKL